VGIAESALQLALYERLKQGLQIRRARKLKKQGIDCNPRSVLLSQFELFASGSLVKVVCVVLTYPHEVVRTRMREHDVYGGNQKYRSFTRTLGIIAIEEGVEGLYGGMGAHLLRVVPNAAVMFLTFEVVVFLCTR